jgi:NAD-dependent SIR2 family protein deacetylase
VLLFAHVPRVSGGAHPPPHLPFPLFLAIHAFAALLASQRNYTQNIDTLEHVAGIHNVVQCHGSFSSASCLRCGLTVKSDEIRADIFSNVRERGDVRRVMSRSTRL